MKTLHNSHGAIDTYEIKPTICHHMRYASCLNIKHHKNAREELLTDCLSGPSGELISQSILFSVGVGDLRPEFIFTL